MYIIEEYIHSYCETKIQWNVLKYCHTTSWHWNFKQISEYLLSLMYKVLSVADGRPSVMLEEIKYRSFTNHGKKFNTVYSS